MNIERRRALGRMLRRCAIVLWSVAAAIVLAFLVVFQGNTSYPHKKDFLLPNGALLILGAGMLALGLGCYWKKRGSFNRLSEQISGKLVRRLSVAVFFAQAYLFYNIYFLTGWDVNGVVNTALSLAEGGDTVYYCYGYFPNNLAITWILTLLFRVNNAIGCTEEPVYLVILVQCAASCLAGYLLFLTVKDMTKASCAFGAWLIYIATVAFSPWISIPYTDTMTLLFPILVLWCYQTAKRGKHPAVNWIAIGFFAIMGYKLKPQCIIILIAVVLCEGIGLLGENLRISRFKQLGLLLAGAAAAFVLWNSILIPSLGITRDPDEEFGPAHYLMMGLNRNTCGEYSFDDFCYSTSFATVQERTAANLQAAKERVEKFGAVGLVRHLARKSLVNFGDGTYAWGGEGEFYEYIFPERNSGVSPFLRDVFYTTGRFYPYLAVFQQFLWLFILLLSIGIGLYRTSGKTDADVTVVISLSLIGLALFQMIFEARARYFFAYSPLFIAAAALGWSGFAAFLQRRQFPKTADSK